MRVLVATQKGDVRISNIQVAIIMIITMLPWLMRDADLKGAVFPIQELHNEIDSVRILGRIVYDFAELPKNRMSSSQFEYL